MKLDVGFMGRPSQSYLAFMALNLEKTGGIINLR
jgi:hypothetical protein